MTKSILWLGFGDIAQQTFTKFLDDQLAVTGMARSEKVVPPSCNLVMGDIADISLLRSVLANNFDVIVITLTPGGRTEAHYQRAYYENVRHVLQCLHELSLMPEGIIFVSSTSVYGHGDGQTVDELTTAKPDKATANILWQTEQLLYRSSIPSCCLRFSGIYGPGRFHLLKQVQAGNGGDNSWTNRIHVQDCAGVIYFLVKRFLEREDVPTVLLATDHQPVRSKEVRQWLAQQLGLDPLQLSEPTSRGMANRYCDNHLLLSLGYQFEFPGYKEGFADVIASYLRQGTSV